MSEPPVRVLLADDQALVRGGFRLMLEQQPDIVVCGEASDGAIAVRLARELSPDVVLMDVRMPHLDGIRATERLVADGQARVLVLTTFDVDDYVVEALRVGASGYLLKDVEPADLVSAIRKVAAGDLPLSPTVLRRVVGRTSTTGAGRSIRVSSGSANASARCWCCWGGA